MNIFVYFVYYKLYVTCCKSVVIKGKLEYSNTIFFIKRVKSILKIILYNFFNNIIKVVIYL